MGGKLRRRKRARRRAIDRRTPSAVDELVRLEQAVAGRSQRVEQQQPQSMNGERWGINHIEGARVLLAEDNADMRRYIRGLLEPHYEVETVANGIEALAAIRARIPDLVISDIMMPGVDGLALLQALREDPQTRTVPVMLLSTRASDVSRVVGARYGADDFLLKPFSARELLARVASRIEIARLRQEITREAERVRESEARFRHVADNMPVVVWMTDQTGACVYVNPTWQRVTGQSIEDAQGNGWLDPIHPEDRLRIAEQFVASIATSCQPFSSEYRLKLANGTYRWFLDYGVPRRGEDGSCSGYIGSCTDITERKESEQMRMDADRRKDEFLAMLAHELRNPLAPMRMALHLIRLQQSATPFERQIRVLERQTDNLARLVDDLLDMSRLTRGKVTLRRERLDISSALSRALDGARGLIDARHHTVSLALPDKPVYVFADAVRLEQILVNLLTNAAKYTEPDGRIDVHVAQIGAQVEVRISDNGVGIAPHMLDRIWHIFQQAERTLDRAQGGLGIGLSIVHQLVELHGGSVEAQSPGLGKGSTFIVRLPIYCNDATHPQEAPAHAPSHQVPASSHAGRKLRVLVVDDNVDAATVIGDLIREQGHEVRIAHDGLAALTAAREQCPEVVFLDIGLPGLDGYEVARRLRANGPCPMRLVAVTGYGQEADRRIAAEAGFTEHLVKPAHPDAVLGILQSAAG